MNFWNNFKNKQNLIIAHRGYSAKYPENTLLAFRKAISKCDFIELDIAFSRDGVAVILHDDTLNRTTNIEEQKGFQEPFYVYDYTLEELKKLDASSWFDTSLPRQSIPTLKEVLAFAKEQQIPLNIEIKDLSKTKFNKIGTKKVLDLVEEFNMQEMVLISSFNHEHIKEAKEINSNIATAAIVEYKHPNNLVEYLKDLDVSSYHINKNIFSPQIAKELQNKGIFTAVYTVNNKAIKEELFKQGARAIFTDEL